MGGHLLDREAVRAANLAYYQAFEDNDLDGLSSLWEHSERATCVHPGWPMLRGWPQISASWFTLLTNGGQTQFIVTNEVIEVVGDVAWVTCDENVLAAAGGATVAALNMFVLSDHQWRLVTHIGSQVRG
jgi:ketosteroid isomerase-like protein